MQLVQYYESLVRDSEGSLAARIMVIPRRSLSHPPAELTKYYEDLPDEVEHILQRLSGWYVREIPTDDLVGTVATIISQTDEISDSFNRKGIREFELSHRFAIARLLLPPSDLAFADTLVHQPLVPFEQSPLGAVSLSLIPRTE